MSLDRTTQHCATQSAYSLYRSLHYKPGPAIVNLVFVLVTELRCVVEVS